MDSDNNQQLLFKLKINKIQNELTKMKSFAGEMCARFDYVILALF